MAKQQTVVRRFDGDRALQAGLRSMAKKGYRPATVNSRKAALGFLTGPFTHKQVHSVVFELGPTPEQVLAIVERQAREAVELGYCTQAEADILLRNTREEYGCQV